MIKNLKVLYWLLIFLFASANCATAATLVEFDTPYLSAELVEGKVNGYYGSSLPEVDGRPSTSCEFFFTSDFVDPADPARIFIKTYYTDNTFDKRTRDDVLTGELLVAGERWTLQMDQVPFGCLNAAGGGFLKGSAIPNDVTKKIAFIGIFVVNKKTYFFDKKKDRFSKQRAFLVPGNAVIAYKKNSDFYFVKYLNTLTSVVTQGWVPIDSVSNPFPQ